ncbi:MAG: DNA repair protein RecO, partial [Patescibacteria group bacterium]
MNKLPIYKTEGIILKSADWGDLDRLLTIYTRGYGKIQARAISARKRDSKLNGLLQSFTLSQFLLAKSKTIDIITDLSVINGYNYLHNNLESLGYAFYFSELIDK